MNIGGQGECPRCKAVQGPFALGAIIAEYPDRVTYLFEPPQNCTNCGHLITTFTVWRMPVSPAQKKEEVQSDGRKNEN